MAGLSRRALLLLLLVGVAGCGSRLMSVVLDLPPRSSRADTSSVSRAPVLVGPGYWVPVDTVRPPIEATLDPDSTRALLPRDNAGNIDWMEALRRGVIKPRPATPGDSAAALPSTFRFGFDFYFPGPNPMFDALFPHSAHTEWVACEHCHTRIFKYRDTQIHMADVLEGRYCGTCHGKVAFPVETGCERCHVGFPQPPDRAEPKLIGDVVMTRVPRPPAGARVAMDSSRATDADTTAESAARMSTGVDSVNSQRPSDTSGLGNMYYPPATFPHWVHRIRYQCKACHPSLFEPEAGSTAVTMVDIDGGEACGACHDGSTAFDAGFGQCHRCHAAPLEPAQVPPETTAPASTPADTVGGAGAASGP